MMSNKKKKEIDDEFAKILGADFVASVNKLPEERTWCCWVLSESEVLKAIDAVGVPESFGLAVSNDNREEFINDVVDEFKDAFFIRAEEWWQELNRCVRGVVEDWQDRKE